MPSAVTDPGVATRVEVVADGAPGLNVTEVDSCTLPSVAVMVSVCATVEASVVVNTPCALVMPEIVPKLLPVPLPDSVTAVFGTRLPWASSTVTVSVVVDIPSAVTDPGVATRVEVVADGAPGLNVTEVDLVHAAFGRGDGLGLRQRRGQRGREHARLRW